MRIGVLARAVDCHVETVRYYEKQGLLPPCQRSQNGYGEYSETHLQVLRLIRFSKGLGFSQKQVRELVRLAGSDRIRCDEAYRLIAEQTNIIKAKITALKSLEKSLSQISSVCERSNFIGCAIFDEVEMGTRTSD